MNEETITPTFRTRKFGLSINQQPNSRGQPGHQWYFRKMIAGRRAYFPLGVDKAAAARKADEIYAFLSIPTNTLDMAYAHFVPRGIARAAASVKWATIGKVLETYEAGLGVIGRRGKSVSPTTFKGYKSGLLTFVRKVEAFREGKEFESFFGSPKVDWSPWLNIGTDFFTQKAVLDYKLFSVTPDPGEELDEEELLTAKISADSVLRCGRAIFSESALNYFEQVGLNLPDLKGFLKEPDFGAVKYFVMLPPDVIANIMRSALFLHEDDIGAYKGYLLAMHCGFRRGECLAFKRHWLREEDRPVIQLEVDGRFSPKSGVGRKVAIEKWVFDELKELGAPDEDEMVRLGEWVKKQIPTQHAVSKPVHELRKCWVSYKAKVEGLAAAAQQAGHKDPKVTTTHYADNLMADRLVPFWRERSA